MNNTLGLKTIGHQAEMAPKLSMGFHTWACRWTLLNKNRPTHFQYCPYFRK